MTGSSYTAQLRERLDQLLAERALASFAGLSGVPSYMEHLQHEIDCVHSSYVGMAVTEIATLRACISGPQYG